MLTDVIISDIDRIGHGGVAFVQESTLTMTRVSTTNILADYFGGFAYVEQSSSVVASDCAFANVRALFDGGHAG